MKRGYVGEDGRRDGGEDERRDDGEGERKVERQRSVDGKTNQKGAQNHQNRHHHHHLLEAAG